MLLARVGDEVLAVDAACTHYGGPLAEGIAAGDTVRCPWHDACFSLRTGERSAPAASIWPSCWRVEREGERIVVRDPRHPPLNRSWRQLASRRTSSSLAAGPPGFLRRDAAPPRIQGATDPAERGCRRRP